MTEYTLDLYYRCNGGPHKGSMSSTRAIQHDGDTRSMLCQQFPQFTKYGWSTDFERIQSCWWNSNLDGLYIRVGKRWGSSRSMHYRIWRPKEWWDVDTYEKAEKVRE